MGSATQGARSMSRLHRIRRTVHALRRHPRASRGSIVAFQSECLRDLVRHAYENVPYYRALFDRHQIHPRAFRASATLRRFPSPEGRLRARPRAVIARGLDPARLRTSVTSGSSGEPFEIRRTFLEHNLLHLFQWRARRRSASGRAIASPKSCGPIRAPPGQPAGRNDRGSRRRAQPALEPGGGATNPVGAAAHSSRTS